MFYESIKQRKSVLYCFARVKSIYYKNAFQNILCFSKMAISARNGHITGKCGKNSAKMAFFFQDDEKMTSSYSIEYHGDHDLLREKLDCTIYG